MKPRRWQLALIQKDEATHMQLTEQKREKDIEIKQLQKQLKETQKLLDTADDACRDKDMLIARLTQKSTVLSELVKFRSSVSKLAQCLIEAEKISLNDSDEEKKNKTISTSNLGPQRQFHQTNHNRSVRANHSMKAAHSMINLSTIPSEESVSHFHVNGLSGGNNKQVKDRLARSLLTGSSYDLTDEDYINSAVTYDVESPSRRSPKELYL